MLEKLKQEMKMIIIFLLTLNLNTQHNLYS